MNARKIRSSLADISSHKRSVSVCESNLRLGGIDWRRYISLRACVRARPVAEAAFAEPFSVSFMQPPALLSTPGR